MPGSATSLESQNCGERVNKQDRILHSVWEAVPLSSGYFKTYTSIQGRGNACEPKGVYIKKLGQTMVPLFIISDVCLL